MEIKDKDLVIRFYLDELYLDGHLKPEELSEKMIYDLSKTSMFARWMLANSIEDVKVSIRERLSDYAKKISWK